MLSYSECIQQANYWERRLKRAYASRHIVRFRAEAKFCIPRLRQWLDELAKHTDGECCWTFDVLP